ncbi:hypothetical protein EWM64_g6118 [Hericium alpestre]|uniref:Uncharacterized protein n=1 Tax=Hericium alpestre TaxID=135208 RepID=A0A4Y9ZUH3_9AGAM|nr:hypothetical protein EWM64_g6118 [Hericium alpestre]
MSRTLEPFVVHPAVPQREGIVIQTYADVRRYGVPINWTFGQPEKTCIDPEEFLREALNDPDLFENNMSRTEREDLVRTITHDVRHNFDLVVDGAHPVAGDPSVRYTFVDCGPGQAWLVLRWWSGRELGYYFDLVNLENRSVLCPPSDLTIEVHMEGAKFDLLTVEEATRRARNVKDLGGTGEERYVVPDGSKLVFSRLY